MCGNGTRLTELSRMDEDQALPATARWRMMNLDSIFWKAAKILPLSFCMGWGYAWLSLRVRDRLPDTCLAVRSALALILPPTRPRNAQFLRFLRVRRTQLSTAYSDDIQISSFRLVRAEWHMTRQGSVCFGKTRAAGSPNDPNRVHSTTGIKCHHRLIATLSALLPLVLVPKDAPLKRGKGGQILLCGQINNSALRRATLQENNNNTPVHGTEQL